MTITYNAEETFRRYHQLMASEPDFFLRPGCSLRCLSERLGISNDVAVKFVSLDLRMTFNQLIRASQLRRVESLLSAQPDRDMKDAIREAGFSSDISFRRAYLEKYGELPNSNLQVRREKG